MEDLPEMQETWVQPLGQEDALKKGMAVHSSILAWAILWTEEPGRLHFVGLQTVGHHWVTTLLSISNINEYQYMNIITLVFMKH